jgi:hypothetical protein
MKRKIDTSLLFSKKEETEEKKDFLYKGQKSRERSWCLGRCFFNWITPLIYYTKKHKKIDLSLMGELSENDKVEV